MGTVQTQRHMSSPLDVRPLIERFIVSIRRRSAALKLRLPSRNSFVGCEGREIRCCARCCTHSEPTVLHDFVGLRAEEVTTCSWCGMRPELRALCLLWLGVWKSRCRFLCSSRFVARLRACSALVPNLDFLVMRFPTARSYCPDMFRRC